VYHSQDVTLEIVTVESLLKDAETGQRGYLYTGEARYLEPYNNAVSEIAAHVDRLAELTADNPRQQSRLPRLRGLVKEKLDELSQTVTLYGENQKAEARGLVLTDRGKAIMDQIRSLTAEMRREEIPPPS
jgi:CHASE3 domain sensor protein